MCHVCCRSPLLLQDRTTALHQAANGGRMAIALELIKKGADVAASNTVRLSELLRLSP